MKLNTKHEHLSWHEKNHYLLFGAQTLCGYLFLRVKRRHPLDRIIEATYCDCEILILYQHLLDPCVLYLCLTNLIIEMHFNFWFVCLLLDCLQIFDISHYRHKIHGIAGDCMLPGLGITTKDKNELVKNVSIWMEKALR